MTKLTIFKRLLLGFFIILAVFAAIGVYSTLKLGQLNQIIRSISSVDSETIRLANDLKDTILTQRKFDKMYVVSQDRDFHKQFLETEKHVQKNLAQLRMLTGDQKNAELLAGAKESYDRYLSLVKEEVALIQSNEEYSPESYEEKKEDLSGQIIQKAENLLGMTKAAVAGKINESENIGYQASRIVAIITMISIIMGILIAFFNARNINRPLVLLIQGTKEIASGKFEKHLSIPSPPEINELAEAFNHMSDRLKELDEMKADLISHISHEFRTPLAVIREAVSLHRDCLSTGDIEKQRRLLGFIEEESERLITSVNKVLNLSRMDAGMMDYNLEESSLSPLIDICVSKVRPIAERKRISLKETLSENLPHAAIDSEKMVQVLDNLLDNALKFTPEGGRAVVRAVHRNGNSSEYPFDNQKGFIEVSVSDTGCGIPEENIHDIFDKFNKLHDNGTGLGLYIARQIVRAHGGDIWVKSEGKNGSTFYFTVPVF